MANAQIEQTRPQTQPLDSSSLAARVPLLAGVGVGLFSLVVYVLTLSPTVNFVDSGELISVGVNAGIAHPPGYPLYTLLIILGGALPFSDRAVGVNLVSALAGALAVALFYALVYEIIRHHLKPSEPEAPTVSNRAARREREARAKTAVRSTTMSPTDHALVAQSDTDWLALGVSVGAALLLASSFTFWSWSTQAKMYTLHYCFVSGLLLVALRARRAVRGAGSPGALWPPRLWPAPARWLILLAFGLGLTFTNHFMSIALVPSLAVLIFWPVRQPLVADPRSRAVRSDASLWRWLLRYLPWLLPAGLLPLLLYLYLPLRSAQQPPLNWGSPSTWGDFWRHVTLWQSRVLIGNSKAGLFDFLGATIERATNQLGPLLGLVALALMVAGVLRLARTSLPLLIATAMLVLFTLVETYNLAFAEVAAYSVPMYIVFILWAAVGLHWLLVALAERMTPQADAPDAVDVQSPRATMLAAVPLVLAVLALIWNIGRAGHGNNYTADAYVHNQFKTFVPNAVVITNDWYLVSPAYYLQLVRHERPDVAIISRKLIQYPFYLDYLKRQYPEVMSTVKDLADPWGDQIRRWVDGEQIDQQQFSTLYFNLMHAIITRNQAAGRPVYLQWLDPDAYDNLIAKDLLTHPEGLSLRVDAQPFTGAPPDPQFDLRGILTDPVPRDDLAPLVLTEYPTALDRLAAFAQQNNHPTEAANFQAQAAQVRAALGLAP